MAESYTTPHSLPVIGTADLIRHPTGDNLRKQLNALATAANNALTAEGVRAEAAAKGHTDTHTIGSALRPLLMAQGTDVNTLHTDTKTTWYTISNQATADTILNLPEKKPGVFENIPTLGFQRFLAYGASPTVWFRGITSVVNKTWGPWTALNGTLAGQADAAQHTVRADMIRKQMGYTIGTAGRGVVMLRFDDYPQDFKTKILPTIRANALPCYTAVTVKHFEELQPTPWSEVQGWAVNDGVQPWNHSWSHGAASTPLALTKEIVESADYFDTSMPAVKIGGWVMPGTGVTPPYGGYNGATDADFYNTVAGKLILSRHGIVNAARPGSMEPAGGHPIGQAHKTFETWSVATFQAEVNKAAAGGYGLSLMAHPQNIGLPGYMSSNDFATCMSWLAGERDAGRVMVLSGHASAVLDPDSDYRHNLLPGPFTTGLNGWSGTGWTWAGGVAKAPATTAALSLVYDTADVAWARGGTRELHAVVKSAAVNTIKVEAVGSNGILNATRTVTIAAGSWVDVRKFFALPYTGDNTITFRISSTTGVTFDVHQINAYAA